VDSELCQCVKYNVLNNNSESKWRANYTNMIIAAELKICKPSF
jgi:hypothetical protein